MTHKTLDSTLVEEVSVPHREETCFLELVDFADRFGDEYVSSSDLNKRKSRGQFFTPKEIAVFMAKGFNISNKKEIRFLDPGAGVGMLTAAFCSSLLSSKGHKSIFLDVYENDPDLIPYLRKTLNHCKKTLESNGHSVYYKIIEKDFVIDNPNSSMGTLFFDGKNASYDCIISNPPYYKLSGESAESASVSEVIAGQPNIYALFMKLSLEMLSSKGEMVFITPRSFCSGLYFKKFRKWLLQNGNIKSIHLFESRKDVFGKAEVLQESVIIKISPKLPSMVESKVSMTASKDGLFKDFKELSIDYEDMLHRKNGDIFIKIPIARVDVMVQHAINSWQYTLRDLGFNTSTGPVVSFRAKEYLSVEFKDNKTVPFLWMHNIRGMDVIWPYDKKNKECAIRFGEGIDSYLLPVNNYVLVKRFSSKEQNRRLYAGVLLKSNFDFDRLGIENHINYIYKSKGVLSVEETYGIAGVLNTAIIDRFFRMMNGNTQVNVIDILNLPLPSIEHIRTIGKTLVKNKIPIGIDLDKAVAEILSIDDVLINALYERN